MSLTYLGKVAPAFILATDLETVDAPEGLSSVVVTGGELTALCPITFAPDIYTVRLEYTPAETILESKALKLYFNGWRDQGIFCENLATVIAKDLAVALDVVVTVTLTQQPRGGLSITATAEGTP